MSVIIHINVCRETNGPKLNMISNKYTGPGRLKMEVLTEANVSG